MILVVDDEPWIVEEMLEAFEYLGEVAIGAHDIDSATAIIESHGDIDMVFTDIRMPGGSGWELVERFDNPSPNTPKFVVITGHEDEYSNTASNGEAAIGHFWYTSLSNDKRYFGICNSLLDKRSARRRCATRNLGSLTASTLTLDIPAP